MSDHDYFLRRAADELAAAERATCSKAKHAHHELANLYLMKIEGEPVMPELPASVASVSRSRLHIIG